MCNLIHNVYYKKYTYRERRINKPDGTEYKPFIGMDNVGMFILFIAFL